MSHFTTIQTQIRDLDALSDACVEMDLQLVPNATCRGYAGMTRQAQNVIKLKGPYDISVEPAPEGEGNDGNGSYGLTTDWWDGHVAKEVGADGEATLPNNQPDRAPAAESLEGFLRKLIKHGPCTRRTLARTYAGNDYQVVEALITRAKGMGLVVEDGKMLQLVGVATS